MILVPGGFGHRGIEGKVLAAHFAREHRIPYLGLCLGLQCGVIEFARDVVGTGDANSTEFDMFTDNPVIDFMPDQREMEDKGGTMRLGLYPAQLTPGSKAAAAYGQEVIYERHRHRFEVNNRYRQTLEAAGMMLSGQSPDGRLVEIVELNDHPWFVASQFHRSSSRDRNGRTRCSTASWPLRSPSATVASRSSLPARSKRPRSPPRPNAPPSRPFRAPDSALRRQSDHEVPARTGRSRVRLDDIWRWAEDYPIGSESRHLLQSRSVVAGAPARRNRHEEESLCTD